MDRLISPGSRFTAAAAVSFVGDWLTTVALATLLYRVIGPAGPAFYMLARVLPRPLGALTGGRHAHRSGPLQAALFLVGAQVLLASLLLVTVLLRQPLLILGVVVMQQCASSALVPTMQALIPRIVNSDAIASVLSRNALAVGVSVVVGPPVGAVLLAFTSPAFTILFDALSFVVAFAMLSTLRVHDFSGPSTSAVSGRARAWPRVRGDRVLWNICIGMAGCYATITALQAGLVPAAVERVGSAGGVGLLYSAVGAGAIIGGLIAKRDRIAATRVQVWMGAEVLGVIALTQTTSVVLTLLLLVLVAGAGSIGQVGVGVAVMKRVELSSLAAVNGVIFAFAYAGMGMGALVALVGSTLRWETPVLSLAAVTISALIALRLNEKAWRIPYSKTSANAALAADYHAW